MSKVSFVISAVVGVLLLSRCGSPQQQIAGMVMREIAANMVANAIFSGFQPPVTNTEDQAKIQQSISPALQNIYGLEGQEGLAELAYQTSSMSKSPANYSSPINVECGHDESDEECIKRYLADHPNYSVELRDQAMNSYRASVVTDAQAHLINLAQAFDECNDQANMRAGEFANSRDAFDFEVKCVQEKGFHSEVSLLQKTQLVF